MVRVLDEDLELAAAIDPGRREQARIRAIAPLIEAPQGPWEPPSSPRQPGRDLGLLVLNGLLLRDIELAGRRFVELRGPEDLLATVGRRRRCHLGRRASHLDGASADAARVA